MKKIVFLSALAGILFSCSNSADNSMSKQGAQNEALTKRFYDEVINAHDVAKIDTYCSEDFVDHNPDNGHSGKGLDDLKGQFNDLFAAIPDAHVTPNFMVANGDTVVAYLTMTGTNTGPMGNMPATNKSFKMDGIDIIIIKDGKAIERWGIFDNLSMMAQLGMMGGGEAPADNAN